MQVVGVTTQQEVWVASRERKFVINEIVVIEDKERGNPRGTVIETSSFNRYIPLATEKNSLVDARVLAGLEAVGYNIRDEEVNLARVRLIGEISTPVQVGAAVRTPHFEEVRDLLVSQPPSRGLVLGVIRGTSDLARDLPPDLSNIVCLYGSEEGAHAPGAAPEAVSYKAGENQDGVKQGGAGNVQREKEQVSTGDLAIQKKISVGDPGTQKQGSAEDLGIQKKGGAGEQGSASEQSSVREQDGVPFVFDYRSMNDYPHIGIFGGSGSGKSFGLRVLLEELMLKKIPGVVLDPHYEMDFAVPFPGLPGSHRFDFSGRYVIYTAGVDIGVDFRDLTSRELIDLLGAGEPLSEAMANAVATLHEGKDSFESFSSRLHILMQALENERSVKKSFKNGDVYKDQYVRMQEEVLEKYKDKVGHLSSLKGIAWRLNNLEREGIFQAGTGPVEEALKERKLVVIRGPVRLLQVYGAYVFARLYRKRRAYRDARQKGETEEYFPPFFLITDEAHNFCMKGDRDYSSKRITRLIAQEGRKYGVQLVLASQRPALLDDTVTSQLNTKIIFRTVRAMDISTIKEETDIEQSEVARLPYLASGNAFVSSAVIGRTVPVRIRCAKTASPHTQNPFDELEEWSRAEEDKFFKVIKEMLPLSAANLHSYQGEIAEKLGRPISFEEIMKKLENLAREGYIEKETGAFIDQYILKHAAAD